MAARRAPAWITPCGSTGRSGPTGGCCTRRTHRSPTAPGAWRTARCSPPRASSWCRSCKRDWSTPPTRNCRRERHLIDFESVLELTAAILIDNRAAADQVRDTFRHFVVDEYQDVNPLQKLLLDTWLGDRDDLCVVGDPHQMIYSFTGATPSYLTGFAAEFPGATVVRSYVTTVHAAGGRGGQPAGAVAPLASTHRWSRSGRRDPSRCSPSTPTTPTRRPGWLSRSRRCWRRGFRPGRSRCWSGSTRTPSGSSWRWPKPACPTWSAAPNGSTNGPWCARRWCCCAAPRGVRRPAPRSPAPGTRCRPRSGTC